MCDRLHHDAAPIHETGYQLLQTGRLCRAGEEHPHFGSVVARLDGARNGLPPFVVLPGPIASTGVDIPHGQSAGWLGAAYDPFPLAADQAGTRAFGITSVRAGKVDDRHMDGHRSDRSCLLARGWSKRAYAWSRSTCSTRSSTGSPGTATGRPRSAPWTITPASCCPTFDQAFTALIDDLERRGRLETTLVVAAGEFGRTPRLNASGGRDHWPGVWSVVLAGGGVRGGQVVGASDAHAGAPADRPVTPQDLLATIYHSLGIESAQSLSRTRRRVVSAGRGRARRFENCSDERAHFAAV